MPGVTEGKMFGSPGLKINSKVFVMLVKGDLVVKLPRNWVDELIAGGKGVAFDPGHGRVMKEWVRIEPTLSRTWRRLAEKAMGFVAGD
jgi:hypothetical protein